MSGSSEARLSATRQAQLIAMLDVFKIAACCVIATVPLLLQRGRGRPPAAAVAHE
jgi:hypothetical protein